MDKIKTTQRMKFNKNFRRADRIIVVVLIIGMISFIIAGVLIERKKLLYCQEYVVGAPNIQGDVDTEYFTKISDHFAIGANAYGYAVFKNPDAAFEELKKNYSLGIDLIQNEFNLDPLSKDNYDAYGTYGWQVTSGTNEEQKQADFVSGFMDIYENSFKK